MGILADERVTREPGTLVLEGLRLSSLDDLRTALGDAAESCIATDLSLGSWRGCQAALELESQLGLSSISRCGLALSVTGSDSVPTYADFVAQAIDGESSGDRVTLDALERACRLATALREGPARRCLVFVPRYGFAWDPHDALLIRFLAQALRGVSRLTLVSGFPEEPTLPGDCVIHWTNVSERNAAPRSKGLLGLVPGIVERSVATLLDETELDPRITHLELPNGYYLLAPDCRRPPTKGSQLEYDRLAITVPSNTWLAAYAQFFGSNYFADPSLLCEQGCERLSEGGYDAGLRLFQRAIDCSPSPLTSAICQSYLQGTRIALRRFCDAASFAEPPRSAPPALRGFLLQCKGWGLVMSDEAARAEPYLRASRDLLESNVGRREYLYLLNISALASLKLGDLAGALSAEQNIERSLSDQKEPDWHLSYINSINLARLHFRRGDMRSSDASYKKAFDTTTGTRSESDAIYANLCQARVSASQFPDGALFAWLRASLHWVSSHAPEALAPRVTRALLGRSLAPNEHLVEAVSRAFIEHLHSACKAARIGFPDMPTDSPAVFLRSVEQTPPCCSLGTSGCSVFIICDSISPVFSGRFYDRLRLTLRALLCRLLPQHDLPESATFLIYDRGGREVAINKAELISACVRLRVPHMRFGSEILQLDEDLRNDCEIASRVQVGNAVDRVTFTDAEATVTFKRYLTPIVIRSEEVAILRAIADAPSLAELSSRLAKPVRAVTASVRLLEECHVVEFELPNDEQTLQWVVSSRF